METKERIDYKALCQAPFDMDSEYEVNFKMLVYTGKKEEERPVFRVVIAKGECKVRIGAAGKEFWGIIGLDPETGENQWYNYNDCVSLENWAVLADPSLVIKTKLLAKTQLAEGK